MSPAPLTAPITFLGVDPGDKRTGLAVGDRITGLATPLHALEIPSAQEDRLMRAIVDATREHGAEALVVGLPLNMDGSEGPRAKLVRAFADRLSERTPLPIHLHDERLTSAEADWAMAGSGLTHKRKKARRDALAAAALLKSYLETLQD